MQSEIIRDLAALGIGRALVVVAHPDDIESWCGGTVAGLVEAGTDVAYLLCTSGDKGSNDPAQTAAQIAALREGEQIAAARELGVAAAQITFARLLDGELEPTLALRRVITGAIRAQRPDLLITHDPAPPYRLHPDHRAVGRAALDAAFASARDRLMFPDLALAPHIVPTAWLFATEQPDLWVDIAATLARKIAARMQHVSQGADPQALPRHWRARAAEAGAAVGLTAAEAFQRVTLA